MNSEVEEPEVEEPERITPLEWFHEKLDEQAAKRAAGTNSPKLCAKRRKQMLQGKLGHEAFILAASTVRDVLPDDRDLAAAEIQETIDNYIQGKDPNPNAEL